MLFSNWLRGTAFALMWVHAGRSGTPPVGVLCARVRPIIV